MRLLEEVSKVSKNRPLVWPLMIVVAMRAIGVALFYQLLSQQGMIHTSWMSIYGFNTISSSSNWLWLFNAWDSFLFGKIAEYGYQQPNYTFLPGYPSLIYGLGTLIGDYWVAGFIITQIFALASTVMFQLVAGLNMRPREALYATLLMVSFPFISPLTILGYSEGLYLFTTLAAWYFYKKSRWIPSSLATAVASITRIYGILIIIPILFGLAKAKSWKIFNLYMVAPLTALLVWALYSLVTTGDAFASLTEEGAWQLSTGPALRYGLVPSILIPSFHGVAICCSGYGFDPALFVAVALIAILIAKVWGVDRPLWGYSMAVFGLMIFTAPLISLLRYLAFIFPVWLTLKLRNPWIVALCLAFFIPTTLMFWFYALTRNFVG
jgi:hypothetical protein